MAKKIVKKKNINNKKKWKKIIVLLIAIIVVLIVRGFDVQHKSDKTRLIISNEDVTTSMESDILIEEGIIYISYEDIKKYIDEKIYKENEDTIITTSDKKVAKLELNKDKIVINGSNTSIEGRPFRSENDVIYLPISEMDNVYDMDFSYNDKNNIITIDYLSRKLIKAYAKKNVSVKGEKSKFSETLEKVKKGNWIIYINQEDNWAKVRTQDGNIGYIKNKNLTNFVVEREDMKLEEDIINYDEYLKKSITKEDISTYKKREKLINTILKETVKKEYQTVKIECDKEVNENIEKFKLEVKPILKECGIDVVFD